MQVRKTFTLDPSTVAVLGGVQNASAYVDRLVQGRERLWRDAVGVVQAAEIPVPALLAAVEALNGYHLSSHLGRTSAALAHELGDAEHDVKPAAWRRLVSLVQERPEVAGALLVLVEEYWAGNAACAKAMSR